MSRYYFNVAAMDLNKHQNLIRHIYRTSIQERGGPLLEGHPLTMICDVVCYRYNVEAVVEINSEYGYIALDMKERSIEDTFKIKQKLKFMTETLLLANITEVY